MADTSPCVDCVVKRTATREFLNSISNSLQICRSSQKSWKDVDSVDIERTSTGSPLRTEPICTMREYAAWIVDEDRKMAFDRSLIDYFQSQPKYDISWFLFPPQHNIFFYTKKCKPSCMLCEAKRFCGEIDFRYFQEDVEFETPKDMIKLIVNKYPKRSIKYRRQNSMREVMIANTFCPKCAKYENLKLKMKNYSEKEEYRRSRILYKEDSFHVKGSVGYLIESYVEENMAYDWVSKLNEANSFLEKRLAFYKNNNKPISKEMCERYDCIYKNLSFTLLQDITVLRLQRHCDNFLILEKDLLESIFALK